jgi:hypothetical protein
MKKFILFLMFAMGSFACMWAGSIDDIRQALEQSSLSKVQEKVFLHTDNTCYFVGDTLWFKGYVVRADNLQPTDMSRLLYVELLTPDGLLVERQTVVVSPNGYTCGQFELKDSLYSGYYELRAYTRWNLNFNVRHHRFSTPDGWLFYNKQMAYDYFRIWDGLYSRVLPIYSKPEKPGDYDARRMYQRPKARVPKPKKEELVVTFYPEGGHLIEGIENRVAFEAVDQLGAAVDISGTVETKGQSPMTIKTDYMGRGTFVVTPSDHRLKASFTWRGKNYSFSLPKAEREGIALRLENDRLVLHPQKLSSTRSYALSVLCRGSLKHFSPIAFDASSTEISLPLNELPTGINDLTVFDDEGRILADRLFFVNHHDLDSNFVTAPLQSTHTYQPYERIELPVQCHGINAPTTFSLSIRDTGTDEPSYNNGDIMTDLLLSSELRGFIASPAHYFEKDDAEHRHHLDLLMMVQGWRKYNWKELSDTTLQLRYTPEQSMTVEGTVYKMLALNEVEPDEISSWQDGVGYLSRKLDDPESYIDPFVDEPESEGLLSTEDASPVDDAPADDIEYGALGNANDHLGVNHGNLRHEVLVEAEIIVGNQVAGSIQETKEGRFLFQIPPFYGDCYLNMKAYKKNDSIKKNMASRKDAKIFDEDAFPDFYVKRDLFYPVYTHPYNYYENHQPDIYEELLIDTLSELSMENDVYQLGTVSVKGKRRGRRAIDWKKPAYVLNAYELYNDLTDRGLSFGKLDMRQFPVQVCRYLYGNMNRYKSYNVDGRIDGAVYYRNYSPLAMGTDVEKAGVFRANRTSQWLYQRLKLKRLQDIRVFTDYDPRSEDSTLVEGLYSADATVELVPIPDDAQQITYRDRHIVFHGINVPEQFYQPDYSERQPQEPTDYRRTLYWNPNAVTDEEGRFTAVFFNNSKPTRIKMSAAGVTADGRLLRGK